MAKKKHRNKNRNEDEVINLENNPFGLDPNQLMNMMGSLDMNKVNSLLESMNKDGVNLGDPMQMINNINNGMSNSQGNMMQNQNSMGSFNPLEILSQLGNMNNNRMKNSNSFTRKSSNNMNVRKDTSLNKNVSNINRPNGEKKKIRIDDENVEMLLAIRKIVNSERVKFIDKVIKKYNEGIFD